MNIALMILLAIDPCAGKVVHKSPVAVSQMTMPAVGITYTDVLGGKVTRITNAKISEGENAVIIPLYSTIQSWSANESYLVLYHRGVGHELYEGQPPYRFLKKLTLVSPSDIEVILWDPEQPKYLYYPSNYNAQPRIYIHDVETNVSYIWMDLATMGHCPVSWAAKLNLGSDPSAVSWLTREPTVGMRCGDKALIINLWRKTVLPLVVPGTTIAPMMAPGGQRFFFPMVKEGIAYNVFWGASKLLGMKEAWSHGSTGSAWQSLNTWYGVDFEEPSPGLVVRTDLETATRKVIVGRDNGWGYPPSTSHISAISREIGWLAASSVGDPLLWGKAPLVGEIIWANSDSGKVCRVVQHRSKAGEGPWGYWSEPHVSISPSGTRAIFGSDWHGGSTVNTYVVDTR